MAAAPAARKARMEDPCAEPHRAPVSSYLERFVVTSYFVLSDIHDGHGGLHRDGAQHFLQPLPILCKHKRRKRA